MCDLILSFYLGLVGLLLIAILIYIYVELVESYDDLNLKVKKIKYKRGEIMERPNKYDFDFSEDYESNLETYCDELEAIVSKGDCVTHYEKEIESLQKALDKACKELENLSYVKGLGQARKFIITTQGYVSDGPLDNLMDLCKEILKTGENELGMCYKEWKEWCMKDE